DDKDHRTRFGFIAQDLEHILPEVVHTHSSEPESSEDDLSAGQLKSVLYQDLIAVLTVALQEQQATIQSLTVNLTALTDEVRDLRTQLDERIRVLEEHAGLTAR
ncbi:hypothetical protein FOZ62_021104, partial [Perkinsus olseni]